MRPDLSIVLPAHNESDQIADTVRRVDDFMRRLPVSHEILLGDDGSTDGTADVVERLSNPRVRIIRQPWRGKGAVLTRCFKEAKGRKYLGFLDADLEIDVRYLVPMLEALENGCAAAIASKTAEPERARNRPWMRRLATTGFNWIVRLLFRTGITDHQAGSKLFRSECLRPILAHVRSTGWLWDTEVLVRLLSAGCTVREIPVSTAPRRESRTVVPAMSLEMFTDLLRLYWRLRGSGPAKGKSLIPTDSHDGHSTSGGAGGPGGESS